MWRRILFSEDKTFYELHQILSTAMGWPVSRKYQFYFRDINHIIDHTVIDVNPNFGLFSDYDEIVSQRNRVSDLRNHLSSCIYSCGEEEVWNHQLVLEEFFEGEGESKVLDYFGFCPKKEVKYLEYRDIMKSIEDPFSEEALSIQSWIDQKLDKNYDIDMVNQRLKEIDCSD